MRTFVSTFTRAAMTLILGVSLTAMANAQMAIEFSTDGGSTFESNFVLDAGDIAEIEVYLTDTDPNGVIATDGLLSFELFVSANNSFKEIDNAIPHSDFRLDPSGNSNLSNDSFIWDAFSSPGGVTGQQIQLGTFIILATSDGTTVFTAADGNPGNTNDWLPGAGAEGIDEQIFGAGSLNTFEFTVNAVPEPSTALLGWGLILAGACRRYRR